MKRKIAFVSGSRSRTRAPYVDPKWEVHGLNEMEYPGRIDMMWEMHPMDVQSKKELEWLRKCDKPIFVLDKAEAVLAGIQEPIEYPLKEILKQKWAIEYFTCTMAYQIAFAIYKGYTTIGLWGLNMDEGSPRERTVESACIQTWMGIARGKGIETIWHDDPATRRYKYGYDYWTEMSHIDNWLCRLNAIITYRLGQKHIFVGGDDSEIRR